MYSLSLDHGPKRHSHFRCIVPAKNVLVINEDPSLVESLQQGTGMSIAATRDTTRLRQKFKQLSFPFIILETKKDWNKDLKRLIHNGKQLDESYIIISSSGRLKKTAGRIKDIMSLVLEKSSISAQPHSKPVSNRMAEDLALEEFVERKLKDVVIRMIHSGGRDLHSILLREVERPLIRIALKETGGNQIQTAHLLGMNRNTLRKKIIEYKIPLNSHQPKKIRRLSA